MVYTKARLEHALKVFRDTRPERKLRGLDDTYLDRHLRHQLRRTTKTLRPRNCQSWNFAEIQHESDEDEYSPTEERRKLVAARRKKKDAALKRRAPESSEEQKSAKKRKGEEHGNIGYVVLRLTTKKGKDKLADLLQDHNKTKQEYFDPRLAAENKRKSSEWRSSDSGSRKRVRSRFDWMLEDESMDVSDMDMDMKDDVGNARIDLESLSRTALRSGRVLKKEVNKPIDDNDNSNIIPLSEMVNGITGVHQHNVLPPVVPRNRSTISIGNSLKQPIEIDSSNDEEERAELIKKIQSIEVDSITPLTQIKSEQALVSTSTQSLVPRPRNRPFGVLLDTSYIHPINFTQKQPDRCDFHTDWTMGVLGHPKMKAICYRDPKNPDQAIIRSGPEEAGRPRTQMCVRCSLARLFIARCHSPQHQSAGVLPMTTKKPPPEFIRIHADKFTKSEKDTYWDYLFPEQRKQPKLRGERAPPFPSCSLCMHPAAWKCCTWQERDRCMKPCRIPQPGRTPQVRPTAATSATVPLSSTSASSSLPIRERSLSVARFGTSISQDSTRPRKKPEVISLLDSSDEEAGRTPRLVVPSKAVIVPSSQLADFLIAPKDTISTPTRPTEGHTSNPDTVTLLNPPVPTITHTQAPTTSTAPTSKPTSQPLQPPIRGCGLHLCTQCHTFLTKTSTCGGLLEKRQVMRYLERCDKRADVEWLFSGSLLEEGVRREREKIRRGR